MRRPGRGNDGSDGSIARTGRAADVAAFGILCSLAAVPAHAQIPQTEHTLRLDTSAAAPEASVEDFAWLAGHWVGEGLGGVSEEMWAPARGGQMLGMYRLVVDDRTRFFELITLLEVDGRVVMRLKHFHPNLHAWEEPEEYVDFPLVRVEDETVYFGGLTYELIGEDELRIWLALRQDGVLREEEFRMRRVAGAGQG